ncbi:hypothetical protein EAI_10465, partial [Harpegnathos saltator]
WNILQHPPLSSLALSDFYLFRPLQDILIYFGKKFGSVEAIENYLTAFFDRKSRNFYEEKIRKLLKHWKIIVENDGDY